MISRQRSLSGWLCCIKPSD